MCNFFKKRRPLGHVVYCLLVQKRIVNQESKKALENGGAGPASQETMDDGATVIATGTECQVFSTI